MKKNLLRIGILLMLGILVIGTALPAMAGVAGNDNQQGKQQASNNGVCTFQGKMNGSGQGMQSQTMLKAVAELSGQDTQEIRASRQAGQSLLSAAKANGVDETALINKITATNQARLKERLDAGTIDQAQYDSCLTQMNERIKERLNRSETGNANAGSGRGNRQGGMGRCQQL